MSFMDLLFKRYASPFDLMDSCIEADRFPEFIDTVVEFHNEEEDEQAMWDVFLHKVWDQSYSEWKQSLEDMAKHQQMSNEEISAVVDNSLNILGNFKPTEEGEA